MVQCIQIRWLAHIIQLPWIKTQVMYLDTGDEGSGKSIIYEMMKQILGPANVSISHGVEVFNSRFNGFLDIAVIEE